MNMNRYTYRGRRKNCAWVYGSLIFKDGIPFILQLDSNMGTVLFAVDPESVGQCLGVADKNKKMIFEGDIVEQYSPMEDCNRRCVVVWEQDAGFAYVCKYIDRKESSGCFLASSEGTYFDGGFCRVIGNAFDNPEMIKI